jgi:putative tricarboxylic transport membrane protein
MRISDRVSGLLLVVLGAAVYYGGSLLPPVPGQQVGPSVFPMVIGAALAMCGALIFFGIGQHFEEAEKVVVSFDGKSEEVKSQKDTWITKLKMFMPVLAICFYAFASEKLGFWLTSSLMLALLSWSMGAKPRYMALLVVIVPTLVHLIFYTMLRVPLPRGLLAFPWA